jgi:predicted nucleic-acid-binding protein
VAAGDSNVVLSLLVQDDDRQYTSASNFLRTTGRIFVSHVVLVEVIWALLRVYGFSKLRVAAAIEKLLEIDEIELEDPTVVQKALNDYRSSSADFSDCLILAIAHWRRDRSDPVAAGSRIRFSTANTAPGGGIVIRSSALVVQVR